METSDPFTLPVQTPVPPIWEWQDNSNWVKYDDETTKIIETAYASKVRTVSLTHGYFQQAGGYTIDFTHMIQIRDATGNERTIRRTPPAVPITEDEVSDEDVFTEPTPVVNNTEGRTQPFWEWFNDSSWRMYDDETNLVIEEAYSQKLPSVPLTHGYFGDSGGYTIDFTSMVQNRDSTGYGRQIRRTPPAVPIPGNAPRTKTRQQKPPRVPYHQPETIHCDPAVMTELHSTLQLLSNKQNDVEEVPVQEIFVDDD